MSQDLKKKYAADGWEEVTIDHPTHTFQRFPQMNSFVYPFMIEGEDAISQVLEDDIFTVHYNRLF
jgi:hypothetical protein